MVSFKPSSHIYNRPEIQMTSMIDIMFINLLFFMAILALYRPETELNISVPKAKEAVESPRAAEEIVINVLRDGEIFVNQKKMSQSELSSLLAQTAKWAPDQTVVIRADEKTYHEHIVRVLDACAKSRLWNISFATVKDK